MSCWRWICDAVFPARCIICRREGGWFCERHNKFPEAPKDESDSKHLDKIWAATAYYSPVPRKAVEFFKFRGFASLADNFAEIISERVPDEVFDNATIIPIPLHWSRKWWRGFNQAEKIAQALVHKKSSTKLSRSLKRKIKTKQQAKLSKKERVINLQDAFVWVGKEIPAKAVLIDDVVASGETLDAAAKKLRELGVKNVTGVVFARGGKACQNSDNEN